MPEARTHRRPPARAVHDLLCAGAAPAQGTAPNAVGGDWPAYTRAYRSSRSLSLGRTNRSAISRLKSACVAPLEGRARFDTHPVVVDRVQVGADLARRPERR